MKTEGPSCSVIIPVYNGGKHLANAIQSVLGQTLPPGEVIVVDDGSTDHTAGVVQEFQGRVLYLYQPNKGVAAARNAGFRKAGGEFISFIDADDKWVSEKLEKQMNIFALHPETGIVIGHLLPVLEPSAGSAKKRTGAESLLLTSMGSMLIRWQVFEKIGNFDEEFVLAEDTDWFFRVREAGIRVWVQQEVVQYYRIHDSNTTRDKTRTNSFLLSAYKRSLDRIRKAGKKS
jgi:glycosyltransferase involved in cell wall biosynthesis